MLLNTACEMDIMDIAYQSDQGRVAIENPGVRTYNSEVLGIERTVI